MAGCGVHMWVGVSAYVGVVCMWVWCAYVDVCGVHMCVGCICVWGAYVSGVHMCVGCICG